MTDFYTWEEWPGFNDGTKVGLERIADIMPDDCYGWVEVLSAKTLLVQDRILVKGTRPSPLVELLEEVVDKS